jgi:hypothetical protein
VFDTSKVKTTFEPTFYLSRLLLNDFASQFPSNRVYVFDHPRDLLPARWRKPFRRFMRASYLPYHSPTNGVIGPDSRVRLLQFNAIEKSTRKSYATGARDYINSCTNLHLPFDPTPQRLARYIAFTSLSIASAGKHLAGACHLLSDLFPSFNANRAHPLVQAILVRSKKMPVHRNQPLKLPHQSFVDVAHRTNGYDDLLFSIILSYSFYGCHQIGE